MFGTCVFQQIVGIPMCANLFSSACFYIRGEADYTPVLLKNNEKELFNSFNFTLRNWQR